MKRLCLGILVVVGLMLTAIACGDSVEDGKLHVVTKALECDEGGMTESCV